MRSSLSDLIELLPSHIVLAGEGQMVHHYQAEHR